MTNEFIFQAGDKVKVPWSYEVYTLKDNSPDKYPLYISDVSVWQKFTTEGRLDIYHDKPILTLIERPKRKVKKTFWFVSCKSIIGNEHRHTSSLFDNRAALLRSHENSQDRQVHSIEIEVDADE